jgi:hypothetical protein
VGAEHATHEAVQAGAKYHTSLAMQRFVALHTERLQVFQLPRYSPEYNSIEKLWRKVHNEGTHVQYFPTFQALPDKVERALLTFAHTPKEILSLCSLPPELTKVA